MYDKDNRIPLIDPILLALKSRRVIVALVTLLVGVLLLAVPELNAVQGELLTLLLTLALTVIGGYSLEDAVRASREVAPMQDTDENLRHLMREVVNAVLDEVGLEKKAE